MSSANSVNEGSPSPAPAGETPSLKKAVSFRTSLETAMSANFDEAAVPPLPLPKSALCNHENGKVHDHVCTDPHKEKFHICSLGTGEVVHILHLKASCGRHVEKFETRLQSIAHCLFHCHSGISDVRVCHPRCGEAIVIITFLSKIDLAKFRAGPQLDLMHSLDTLIDTALPSLELSGTLYPDTHTLKTILEFLKQNVRSKTFSGHNTALVARELAKWFPRRSEYESYIHWDKDPTKYTRNLIFRNEFMDVILMCWPAGCMSSIHCHDESSCWVAPSRVSCTRCSMLCPSLIKRL